MIFNPNLHVIWLSSGYRSFAFDHRNMTRVIYRGKLTGKFATQVRDGHFDVDEGVICKGWDTSAKLWMVKIKTNDYRARLKTAFQAGWESYWE